MLHRNSRTIIEDPWIRNATKLNITLQVQFIVPRPLSIEVNQIILLGKVNEIIKHAI
uniref:Uncharacterized protein n=1 Tax=Arundo donax TaxID=35708 RepID=A0A0A9CKP9_ARUDO